jgi:site-specific recombinase XerD
MALDPADRVALAGIEAALAEARRTGDGRSPFAVIASLTDVDRAPGPQRPSAALVSRGREEWLRRLRSGGRSESAIRAYRNAIDDVSAWAQRTGRVGELFEETAIVDYLDDYRSRLSPMPATYHRRFLLVRRFLRWLSQREGVPDPFSELAPPPKPRHHGDWLTTQEFASLLQGASRPSKRWPGLAARDRLVLLALVTTGLRRSELIALEWSDLDLDGSPPSLLVRHGKGDKPRRQPLAPELAADLARERSRRASAADAPVFCGLEGRRLQPAILADIIRRASSRAGLEKRVTAHTLRHTAATWLRQATGDARLVAEYLGHADLSTVSRYAHVAGDELHAAASTLADWAGIPQLTARIDPVDDS